MLCFSKVVKCSSRRTVWYKWAIGPVNVELYFLLRFNWFLLSHNCLFSYPAFSRKSVNKNIVTVIVNNSDMYDLHSKCLQDKSNLIFSNHFEICACLQTSTPLAASTITAGYGSLWQKPWRRFHCPTASSISAEEVAFYFNFCVCLSVYLSVSQQDNFKSCGQIFMKVVGGFGQILVMIRVLIQEYWKGFLPLRGNDSATDVANNTRRCRRIRVKFCEGWNVSLAHRSIMVLIRTTIGILECFNEIFWHLVGGLRHLSASNLLC